MNKQRWAQLSGLKAEEPILMVEGDQPVYKDDLAQMIREEVAKAIKEATKEKDLNDINLARRTKSASAAMGFSGIGFASSNSNGNKVTSNGRGGTISLGPGFM